MYTPFNNPFEINRALEARIHFHSISIGRDTCFERPSPQRVHVKIHARG